MTNPANQIQKADEITAKLHALLHTAEGMKGEITYLDIARICEYLKTTYFSEGMPIEVKAAFEKAARTCRPATIEKINLRNKIFGLLALIPGGIMALNGFGSLKSNGIIIKHPAPPPPPDTRWFGSRWWHGFWDWAYGNPPPPAPTAPPDTINWDAIYLTVIGVILVVVGIYLVRRRGNPKYQASVAEAIIQNAINQWANSATGIDGKATPLIEESPK